ncbi:HET-domain-containing protein [Thozetella sp. PMI_491]|nr:HET-domain-containing protein [Thozetella sp. PMI_491]
MAYHEIYSKCPLGPDDIRLVTVLPGRGQAQIVCQLETVYFPPSSDTAVLVRETEHSEYKALSYTWGTDRDTRFIHFIHFEGFPLGVTRNLFEALIHLRNETTPLVLWVDAICIDQRSKDEKNRQLPRMRQIYAQATETILWLGSATFFLSRAFRTAESLLSLIEHRGRSSTRPEWVPIWIWESFSLLPKSMDYVSLVLLLRSQYFARTWIVQEIVLSPNPVFVAGHDRVRFHDLAKVAETIKLTGIAGASAWRLAKILSLRPPASQRHTRLGHDLVAVASLLRNSHAADPRDKLYGFLGLCEHIGDVDTYGLEPDYGLTVTEVYTRFAASVLGCQKSLDLLGFVQRREDSRLLELPSWVPDWSDTNAVALPLTGRSKDGFAAAGDTEYLPSHAEDR